MMRILEGTISLEKSEITIINQGQTPFERSFANVEIVIFDFKLLVGFDFKLSVTTFSSPRHEEKKEM